MHLGMSGSLAFDATGAARPPGTHDHFDLVTTRGVLRLTDPRRFGAVVWSPALDAAPAATLLARLGAEPFDAALDAGSACTPRCKRRRTPIKPALLAGDIVVGAGNIYACEALFEAGIDPRTRSDRVSARAPSACWPACARRSRARSSSAARPCATSAMRTAATAPTSSRPASTAAPASPAGAAARTVRRIVQGQRSTFFCPGCQKR